MDLAQVIIETLDVKTGSTLQEIAPRRTEVHTFVKDVRYKGEMFIDTLFTAVSALCVTGLISTDFSQFTLAGQIITMILIQIGGLGIILATSIFAVAVVRGISDRESFRNILSGVLDTPLHSVRRMIKHVVLYTFLFEGTAFLIMGLYLDLVIDNPAVINNINPWWWSLFHSVSAFNNAGFGLMNNNLSNFVTDPVINGVISALIILGGLGYPVLIGMHTWLRKFFLRKDDSRQQTLAEDIKDVVASAVQIRVALIGTVVLLFVGTVGMLLFDWHSAVLQQYSFFERVLIAFFHSVSTRTAGFNTVDIGAISAATTFLYIILMYIGANPAGTAGGIKIPTFAVLYGYIKDWFREPGQPVELFKKRISKFAVSHAVRLFFFSIIFISSAALAIFISENQYIATPDPIINVHKIIFELFSAFGTVGLSMGFAGGVTSLSAIFTPFSKLVIIATMLFGRLGPLTILAALPWKRRYENAPLSPDFSDAEKIQIG